MQKALDTAWEQHILPTLMEFVRIPALSPGFDADWARNGHIDAAVALAENWCRQHAPEGTQIEVLRLPGRTPLLFVEIPGTGAGEAILYGHLDKQPESTGWDAGKGPWTPVIENDRLYGRGAADDGYAMFASLWAIRLLHDAGLPYPTCRLVIECAEESGSPDLPACLNHLGTRLGNPGLVVCLDSGCANYDQLWVTTSLRGMLAGDLTVKVLEAGVHSGDASGVVPSSFRIARELLDRIEDTATGKIKLSALQATIPEERQQQALTAAAVIGEQLAGKFPFTGSTQPLTDDPATLILNRTWRPWLEIIGAEGLPPTGDAGNVLRPGTTLRLSMRLPPTVPSSAAAQAMADTLTANPPYGASVSFNGGGGADGWDAPAFSGWLGESLERASKTWFGKPAVFMGEGGSIPLMNLLAGKFPAAKFLVTGVLGPGSNAHGPNEFLHLPMARRLTGVVAEALTAQATTKE